MKRKGCFTAAAFVAVFFVGMCVAAPRPAAKSGGDDCLTGWDQFNRSLLDQVKAGLDDPSSFEHDSTTIAPAPEADGTRVIRMIFRARNRFGALVRKTAYGSVDMTTCSARLLIID